MRIYGEVTLVIFIIFVSNECDIIILIALVYFLIFPIYILVTYFAIRGGDEMLEYVTTPSSVVYKVEKLIGNI